MTGEGTGVRRQFLIGWAIAAGVVVTVTVVNALTVIEDVPDLDWWEPWVWEISSAAVVLALAWIPWLAVRAAPPGGRWPRFAGVHAGALLAYSALHVGGFLVLRHAAYALVGTRYAFDPLIEAFPYELRKDLISYAALAATFWLVGRFSERRAWGADKPATFDVRDGGRIIRTPLDQIIAVSSAGNYVEFWLDDGRRPLMRATLTAIEGELGPFGFVRAHRSWLLNSARVTGLSPDGSGDWTVDLGAVQAPLSRRYRVALERLKG